MAYLVRDVEEKKIQGIVWGSLDEIWDTVDEWGDPALFEFARLPSGGLMDPRPIVEIPNSAKSNVDEVGFDFAQFVCSGKIDIALDEPDRLRWRRFDCANVGHGMIARLLCNKTSESAHRLEESMPSTNH